MESRTSFLVRLLLLALLPLSFALKFDIQAHPGAESASKERCIRNFVAKDQLVVVTATISGHRGDGQVLNLHVSALEWLPGELNGNADMIWPGLDQGCCRQ
jgi:hypothetical protein